MTAFLLVTCMPNQLTATTTTPVTTIDPVKAAESIQADALIIRLKDIKEMDKSSLSSSEKRELRKETRAIKGQLKALSGGVYLSVGAVILIVVLLLLLL